MTGSRHAVTLLALAMTTSTLAQCLDWAPGVGMPGTDAMVYASTVWDPDGTGPRPSVLLIGGNFRLAGEAVSPGIAQWDGVRWTAFGPEQPSLWPVYCLHVLADGTLIAAGASAGALGVDKGAVVRWNGTDWETLSTELIGQVFALAQMQDGSLLASGLITLGGGSDPAEHRVYRLDGEWSAMGGILSGAGRALAILPDGSPVVAGEFSRIDGQTFNRIARWDGAAWVTMGSGTPGVNGGISAMTVLPSGELMVGGAFSSAGGAPASRVAKWNGSAWSALGAGVSGPVYTLEPLSDGSVAVGGLFSSAGGAPVGSIARWNPAGSVWSTYGGGVRTAPSTIINTITSLPSGELAVAGSFMSAGGVPVANTALWNGTAWAAMGEGSQTWPSALLAAPEGLYAGGSFDVIGGVAASGVAVLRDGVWSQVGGGLRLGTQGGVNTFARRASGELFAAGFFSVNNEPPAANVARWDGSSWSALPALAGGLPYASTIMPNGDLVVGGSFTTAGGVESGRISRWNGVQWALLPGGGFNGGTVYALAAAPNGDLFVGGAFGTVAGRTVNSIARWNGGWFPLGSGVQTRELAPATVTALAIDSDGSLLVGGSFYWVNDVYYPNLARWRAGVWSDIGGSMPGSAYVHSFSVRPDGQFAIGGVFGGPASVPSPNLAVWDGAAWMTLPGQPNNTVKAVAYTADGDLHIGGLFSAVGNRVSAHLARLSDSAACPADFTCDAFLDFFDYADFVTCFETATCPSGRTADFNRDDFVDFFDYADFVAAFEAGC